MGSLSVSALLIAGGLGIGIHSLELLLATLNQIPLTSATDAIAAVKRSNDTLLDPNAAWFALSSVLVKEWLYRISKSI
jgi:divalent metal cation (Fe/Co/Zn/Cd) transporter